MSKISRLVGQLGTEKDSTEVVHALGRTLLSALERAFGVGRRAVGGACDRQNAAWWTQLCADSRDAMLRQKANMRATGQLDDAEAKREFSRLRTFYQRTRREARECYQVAHFDAFLQECKADPRALWRRLNEGAASDCPITDVADWSEYFDALYNGEVNAFSDVNAEAILSFINGAVRGEDGRGWERGTAGRDARVVAAAALNTPFALEEVVNAVRSLRNNRSGGLDRVPAECLKYASKPITIGERVCEVNVLAPHLLVLLEHIRSTGDFPRQFCESSLTPIHKKGDVLDKGNYRGLAVGGVLAKLYAFILESRLSNWADGVKARLPWQGGFIRSRGTLDNLLVLRHLTDKHKSAFGASAPLFVCQIDFEKAFDKVPRHLLWLRLQERGVHGEMLEALKKGYEQVMMRVKVNGSKGAPFESTQGVKQGCPLSPPLFGFFVETFGDYVRAKDQHMGAAMAAGDCPVVDGQRIPLIFYADDLSLFANTHRRLMCLLNALREFCEAFGMKVNVKKSEVLGFHPSQHVREGVRSAGNIEVGMRAIEGNSMRFHVMPWLARARYLGLHYGPDTPFESCTDELFASGQRAMYALIKKLRRQGLFLPGVGIKCFHAHVRSILSYGAQIWAPDALLRVTLPLRGREQKYGYFERALKDRMVQLQRAFLRRIAGVSIAPDRLLFRELDQSPLQVHWAELLFRFWNRLVKADGTIYQSAFREEIRLALTHGRQYSGWGIKVLGVLNSLGYSFGSSAVSGGLDGLVNAICSHELDVASLMDTLRGRFNDDWNSSRLVTDPRFFVSDGLHPGVKMCRHARWMGASMHLKGYIPNRAHISLMRFRLCVWALEVNRPGGRPRDERWCRVCGNRDCVEDERHVLLECPEYVEERELLWPEGVPPPGVMMSQVMAMGDQRVLARVIHAIKARRTSRIGVAT